MEEDRYELPLSWRKSCDWLSTIILCGVGIAFTVGFALKGMPLWISIIPSIGFAKICYDGLKDNKSPLVPPRG